MTKKVEEGFYPAKLSSEYDGFLAGFTVILVCTFMKWTYSSPGSSV
jgi:hypothetical protein